MAHVTHITLGDIASYEVAPGERFVLTCPRMLSFEQVERIQSVWRQFVAGEVPLLVLDDGMTLAKIKIPAS